MVRPRANRWETGFLRELVSLEQFSFYPQDETAALVFKAQQGEQTAICALLNQYQPLLHATGLRYRSSTGYEDAYQEACAAFLEAIRAWQPAYGVPFPAFVKASVRGTVRTVMRRTWRYEERRSLPQVHAGGVEPVNEVWDEQAAGIDEAANSDTRLFWAQVLVDAHLSQREALYFEEMARGRTPQQLARLMGVSTETVKTWRKRGLAKIRRVLTDKADFNS